MEYTANTLIDLVLRYYRLYPRSVSAGGCCYQNENGNRCAFSIFLTQQGLEQVIYRDYNDVSAMELLEEFPISIIKPRFRKVPLRIWLFLQNLHDNTQCWSKIHPKGQILSDLGQQKVKAFLKEAG